jgi:uncharacterized protein (TIGR00730 family)
MMRVAVYCGSSRGSREAYAEAARALGRALAQRGIALVYGGGNVGLMGVIAQTVMKEGGEVIGVIPRFLERKEIAYHEITELRLVDTMHQRKQVMEELADGFIAMPGGFGTLEEFFEILTWAQLGHHSKPCGLLNVEGYYDQLLAMLRHGCEEQFIRREYYDMVICHTEPKKLLDMMEGYQAPWVEKWLDLQKV